MTRNVFIALALVSGAACGGGSSSGPVSQTPGNTPAPPQGISVTNNAFTPATKTVTVGTTVQWAWNSCTGTGDPYGGNQLCASHNVTFDDGSASSSTQEQGTFTRIFNAAGTFNYHCTVHPMTGAITVQ